MFKGLLITVHVHARFKIHVNTRFTVMVFAVCGLKPAVFVSLPANSVSITRVATVWPRRSAGSQIHSERTFDV